jgi:Tol biopolymer transport system component
LSLAPPGPDEFLFVNRDGNSLVLAGEDGSVHRTFTGLPYAAYPIWSSDGKSFVATEAVYPRGATFLIRADDSARTALPAGEPVAFLGGSRDGTVLIRTATPSCSLTSFKVDTGVSRCLRSRPFAAVSPDGTRVIWEPQNRPGELWIASVGGTDSMRVTTGYPSVTRSGFLVWSPNSQWFAFEQQDGENIDVYRADRDGRSVRNLTPSAGYDSPTGISPDGKWLAFISFREPRGTYLTSVDGTGARWLTDVMGRGTQWSPDGEQIVMVASDFRLAIVQADGAGQQIHSALNLGVAWKPRN